MITIETAKSIVDKLIPNGFHITSIKEGNLYWYFGVKSDDGLPLPGISPIVIDKKTGNSTGIPSVPYYVRNEDPLPIELDYENAITIM